MKYLGNILPTRFEFVVRGHNTKLRWRIYNFLEKVCNWYNRDFSLRNKYNLLLLWFNYDKQKIGGEIFQEWRRMGENKVGILQRVKSISKFIWVRRPTRYCGYVK